MEPDKRFLEPDFLTSWKEIADYLGKGVRTVQRWEEGYGLPVERLDRGRVRVSRAKLDRWLKDNWVVAGGNSPPAIPVNGSFAVSKLIEKCEQLKAENREQLKRVNEKIQKRLEDLERIAALHSR